MKNYFKVYLVKSCFNACGSFELFAKICYFSQFSIGLINCDYCRLVLYETKYKLTICTYISRFFLYSRSCEKTLKFSTSCSSYQFTKSIQYFIPKTGVP